MFWPQKLKLYLQTIFLLLKNIWGGNLIFFGNGLLNFFWRRPNLDGEGGQCGIRCLQCCISKKYVQTVCIILHIERNLTQEPIVYVLAIIGVLLIDPFIVHIELLKKWKKVVFTSIWLRRCTFRYDFDK